MLMKFKGFDEMEVDIGYNTINILYVPDSNKIRAIRKRKSFPKDQFRFVRNSSGEYSIAKLPGQKRKNGSIVERSAATDLKSGLLFFDVAAKYKLCGRQMQKIIKKYQIK